MDTEALKAELSRINDRHGELEAEILQCKERRDKVQKERIKKELKLLANRAKHILFKLGKYQYEEDDIVEFSPGQSMPANVYHWLKD